MNTTTWISLCAATVVLLACERGDHGTEKGDAAEPTSESPVAPGDQTTTPGGVAGETAATPPGTQPDAYPPETTTPADTEKKPGE